MSKQKPVLLLDKTWRVVSGSALILGLLASVTSILTYSQVDRLEARLAEVKTWTGTILLAEPRDSSLVAERELRISGRVDFRTTAVEIEAPPRMDLLLLEKKIDLVPFVRPLSEAGWWWAQPAPLLRQDGSFAGMVLLGEQTGAGPGLEYQIAVLAVPRGSVSQGASMVDLPTRRFAASNVVTIRRTGEPPRP